MATWQPAVIWKIENVLNKLGDLTKELSKQSTEGADSCTLDTYSAMKEEKNKRKNC